MKYYKVLSLTKPGQSNKNTKFDSKVILSSSHGPITAAKKAITRSCKKTVKKIKGQCTFTITIGEVVLKTINGVKSTIPVLDSQGIPIRYKYTLKRIKDEKVISFNGKEVPFKYSIKTIENFGRVI